MIILLPMITWQWWLMVINFPQSRIWWQLIPGIKAGTTYIFSTWLELLTGNSNLPDLKFTIKTNVSTDTIGSIKGTTTGCDTWTEFYSVWTAPVGISGNTEISIVNNNTQPGDNDFALDDILFYEPQVKTDLIKIIILPDLAAHVVQQPTCTIEFGTIKIDAPLGAGITYNIDGGAFQPSDTFKNVSPGSHIISVKDAQGTVCQDTTVTINARPAIPTVTVSPNPASICIDGSGIVLTASGADTYSWSSATGLSATTGSSVTANPASTTTYKVLGILTSSTCEDSALVTVTVNPLPAEPNVPARLSIAKMRTLSR